MKGRPALEVADIFREFGPAWRDAQRGHLNLAQLKVMSAIEQCRSAALGGHVLRCGGCGADQVSYNSCRNRHCPKCQSRAAQRWLDARQVDLLPLEYYHNHVTGTLLLCEAMKKHRVRRLVFSASATVYGDPRSVPITSRRALRRSGRRSATSRGGRGPSSAMRRARA